jgi:EpsI family protein
MKVIVAIAFLALQLYIYQQLASEEVFPARSSFEAFPLELDAWSCEGLEPMPPAVERNLGVTDHLICDFRRADPPAYVNVYVGYHESQVRSEGGGAGGRSIHPPKHCMPGSGWDIVGHEQIELDLPGLPQRPARVNRVLIAKGLERRLVYYWYQSRGRVVADDWRKIVLMSWDRARLGRSDGSLVRFTAGVGEGREEAADETLLALAALVVPELPAYLPE